MKKLRPGLIELSDIGKHCDYLLIEITPGLWKIRVIQYDDDWNESNLKVEDFEQFKEDSEYKAIRKFMDFVSNYLIILRGNK